MGISAISLDLGQSYLLDQVGSVMLGKTLKGAQSQAAELLKALPTPAPLAEGAGRLVDLFA